MAVASASSSCSIAGASSDGIGLCTIGREESDHEPRVWLPEGAVEEASAGPSSPASRSWMASVESGSAGEARGQPEPEPVGEASRAHCREPQALLFYYNFVAD